MKSFLIPAFLLFIINIKAQSFYQNALVIDANGGLEIYNTKVRIHNNLNNRDTLDNDKTGSTHFTIGAEYGLHKNFGLGLRYKGNNFFVDKDTTGNGQETVKSTEILLQLNFHPVSTEKFDLVLGSDVGYSKINYSLTDKDRTKIWGTGTYFSFYVNPRLYIGRFGFNAKLYTPFFNYPNLQSNNVNFGKDQTFRLSGIPGFGFSIGLQFRFMDKKTTGAKTTAGKEEPKKEGEKK